MPQSFSDLMAVLTYNRIPCHSGKSVDSIAMKLVGMEAQVDPSSLCQMGIPATEEEEISPGVLLSSR
jgi:hypothetical protein